MIIVTGGTGFLGSFLAERLIREGRDVTIVDDLSTGDAANIAGLKCSFVRCDINDRNFLDLVDNDTEAVYHFAANAYVPTSIADPRRDFRSNVEGTFNLLEHVRKCGLGTKILYASSAAVYGNPSRNPIFEHDRTLPVSPYGCSKLAGEHYCTVYSKLYGLKTASLRFFSSFGPRLKKQVIYDFMCKLRENGKVLKIAGDGKQVRDFNYVDNHIDAALVVKDFDGSVFNVASGRTVTVLDVAKGVSAAMGLSPRFEFDAERKGDPVTWVPNIDKIKGMGYKPKVGFEEGIKRTVEWLNGH